MKLSDLQAIVFDFDGVLTDNKVYVDQDGREMVCCSRSDGLAFATLLKSPIKGFPVFHRDKSGRQGAGSKVENSGGPGGV